MTNIHSIIKQVLRIIKFDFRKISFWIKEKANYRRTICKKNLFNILLKVYSNIKDINKPFLSLLNLFIDEPNILDILKSSILNVKIFLSYLDLYRCNWQPLINFLLFDGHPELFYGRYFINRLIYEGFLKYQKEKYFSTSLKK